MFARHVVLEGLEEGVATRTWSHGSRTQVDEAKAPGALDKARGLKKRGGHAMAARQVSPGTWGKPNCRTR